MATTTTPPVLADLKIHKQEGTNQLVATWVLADPPPAPPTIKSGVLCVISEGAKWQNGTALGPELDYIYAQKWYASTAVKGSGTKKYVRFGQNEAKTESFPNPKSTSSGVRYDFVKPYVAPVDPDAPTPESEKFVEQLENYEVKWYYATGETYYPNLTSTQLEEYKISTNIIWFSGGSSTTEDRSSLYSPPENATMVKVSVEPKAKQKPKSSSVYWTAKAKVEEYTIETKFPPDTPDTPNVSVSKYKLTVTTDNIKDAITDKIEYEVHKEDGSIYQSGIADVIDAHAMYVFDLESGSEYRVRARALNVTDDGRTLYSGFSGYSSKTTIVPPVPSGFKMVKAMQNNAVYFEWDEIPTATSYKIQYATKKEYLDNTDATSTIDIPNVTQYTVTNIAEGAKYFFRLAACNSADPGQSEWSADIYELSLGSSPAAPTTWSSSSTAILGDPITLYWIHNAGDNSSVTYSEIELYLNNSDEPFNAIEVYNDRDDKHKDDTNYYELQTSNFSTGTSIQWRIRTSGVAEKDYGEWSVKRELNVYAPPVLQFKMEDLNGNTISTLTSLPFKLTATAGPLPQKPISYQISIVSLDNYESTNSIGETRIVFIGDELFSNYYDTSENLDITIGAGDIQLDSNHNFRISCIVTMDSGLNVTSSIDFDVDWEFFGYYPNVELSYDSTNMCTYIRPYCISSDGGLVDNVLLSVYRKDYDGTFIEIATGLNNLDSIYVTDPHPSLDYARYRIIATSMLSGVSTFYDPSPFYIGEPSIVIQWSEKWTSFGSADPELVGDPKWSGSMVRLPFNVDVSDSQSNDVNLVKYIGREYPVSYYGTQLGHTSNMKADIAKSDVETIYALRRLQRWMGDVYIREPTGTGYWANVSVSFGVTHLQTTIPVTISVSRVEGGR